MKTVRHNASSRFFFLELRARENSKPTAEDVCESIKKFARGIISEVVFVSSEMPVKFYLDGTIYSTTMAGSAGSPIVLCYQES